MAKRSESSANKSELKTKSTGKPAQASVAEGPAGSDTARESGGVGGAEGAPAQGTRAAEARVGSNVLIRASAGTGKTYQLSNRYLQLVLAGNAPERILATTFTRKAAGEILDRILFRLAHAARDEGGAAELAKQLGLPDLTLDRCRAVLRQLTTDLHRLRVSTLDSFFLQVTQSLSLELGLPPAWQILDDADNGRLHEESLTQLLERSEEAAVMQLCHWLAKGEVKRGVRELLLESVREMYDQYLETPADAWRRIKRQTALNAIDLARAIESLADYELEKPGKRLSEALDSALASVRAGDWDGFLSKGLGKSLAFGDGTYYRAPLPEDLVPILEPLVKHSRAEVINTIVTQTEATHELLDQFHGFYEAMKLDRRSLRFSDLARYLSVAMRGPLWDRLAFRLDARIESLLLDEFQDTSLHQWQVIRPFAQVATDGEPGRSFLCVGDVKQAIYGWRGGDADLLGAIGTDLEVDLETRDLGVSHRSAQPIMDVVNQINRGMVTHSNLGDAETAVRTWADTFPEHGTARQGLPGWVVLETSDAAADSSIDEKRALAVQLAAQRVRELRDQAPHLSIAILVRTNSQVGQAIYELQRLGIDASEEGGNPLVDAAAVQLIVSRLKLAEQPYDTAARFHLAQSPWAATLGLPGHRDDGAAERLAADTMRQLADDGFGATMAAWATQLAPYANLRERRRLRQLVELGDSYQLSLEQPRTVGYLRQVREPLGTSAFVERIEEESVRDPSDDPVRVMTVHQSKGLQFDVVILPDLDNRLTGQAPNCVTMRTQPTEPVEAAMRYVRKDLRPLFPNIVQRTFDLHAGHEFRENLCVLYVALTRAVHCLHMIVAPDAKSTDAKSTDAKSTDAGVSEGNTDEDQPRKRSSEAKLPLNSAGLVRAALVGNEPLSPSTVVYRHGDPEWLAKLLDLRAAQESAKLPQTAVAADSAAAKKATTRSERPAASPHLAKANAARASSTRRELQRVRPSSLEGAGERRLRDRFPAGQEEAMRRGDLVHARLQELNWLDEGLPGESEWLRWARSERIAAELVESARTLLRESLAKPDIQQVLSRAYYAPWLEQLRGKASGSLELQVRCEQPLLAMQGDEYLSGSIDRLVIVLRDGVPYAADILDFKTDQVASAEELKKRTAFYKPQLEAYARGLEHMLRIPASRITSRLVFLSAGKVVGLS
jgi:ATP-dependent helicase/nuclease subunit A